jgi:3-deoxy-alpha-D-manno-octulosonate 8-oxidase
MARIPVIFEDRVILISADEEPKTEQVDALVEEIRSTSPAGISAIVGIGGGTLLDLAKAVAIMLNNPGKTAQYQGWDLVSSTAWNRWGAPI